MAKSIVCRHEFCWYGACVYKMKQEVPMSPFMVKPRGIKVVDIVFCDIPGIFLTQYLCLSL
jgi:hypothetical protein